MPWNENIQTHRLSGRGNMSFRQIDRTTQIDTHVIGINRVGVRSPIDR
jgi:hypothetical protein